MTTPVSWDDLYPGRFLRAGNLHGKPATVVIEAITVEEMEGEKDTKKRPVLTLRGTAFQYVPCVTDGLALRAMFGESPADYVGKRITLTPTMVKFGRDTVPAIRIIGSPDMKDETISRTYKRGRNTITVSLRKTEK